MAHLYDIPDPFGPEDDTFRPLADKYGKPAPEPSMDDWIPLVLESAAVSDSVSDYAGKYVRSRGMATALQWIENGEHTFDDLDALVYGMVDADEDGVIGPDEQADYEDLYGAVSDAFLTLGASPDNVKALIEDEDDEAGAKLGTRLTDAMNETERDDYDVVNAFALESVPIDPESGEMVLEAVVKRVRGGKVVSVKKRMKKRRMTAKQRAALKKARRKSNNAAARKHRAKAMKIRKSRNM